MNKTEEKAFVGLIIVSALVVIIIIIAVQLALIQLSRMLFWFDVVFIPLSLIVSVIAIINIFRSDDWNKKDWMIIGGISLCILFFTVLTINFAYNVGYSDEAIKKKAELERMLEDYTFILSVYTGEFRLKVQGMAVNEINKALCEAVPEVPCNDVIQIYDSYNELVGWKNSADGIVKIWRSNKLNYE